MAYMLMHFEIEDFEAWKQVFDSDPAGRKGVAKGHQIFRAVDDPKQVFVATEYGSVEDAQAVRERLLASGVLNDMTTKTPPTVVEVADSARY
jgi:hypothetical protein